MATPLTTKPSAATSGWCLIALLTALPSLVQANDYRLEVRGGFSQLSSDHLDRDTLHGAATAYFSPVETDGHPLAEAAFMERASGVTLSHRRFDYTASDSPEAATGSTIEQTVTQAKLDYYLPENPLFVSLSVSRATAEEPNMPDYSDTLWSGAVGVTPVDGLLVTSNFHEGQDIGDDWNLNARYVMPSRHFEAMAFQAGYQYHYGVQAARWSLDTYLDRTLSLGIGYGRAINTGDDGTLDLRAQKFFTDRFSLSTFFSHHRRSDQYGLEAGLRF